MVGGFLEPRLPEAWLSPVKKRSLSIYTKLLKRRQTGMFAASVLHTHAPPPMPTIGSPLSSGTSAIMASVVNNILAFLPLVALHRFQFSCFVIE